MGKILNVFSLKIKDSSGLIYEPEVLHGKDAKTIYSYSLEGGNLNTEAAFISKFSRGINPYPVNSIYISGNSISPALLFGGTWEAITDKFLLCAGDTYVAGETGGEENVTLTVDTIPSHLHHVLATKTASSASSGTPWPIGYKNSIVGYFTSSSVGGSGAHNNMPPYVVKYIWKRVS